MEKKPLSLDSYIDSIDNIKGDRLSFLRDIIKKNFPHIVESMKYKMPTFEINNNWVAAAGQKNYLSVYFCSPELIKDFKTKYPKISTGKCCLNIKDKDDFPLKDIETIIVNALNMKK